MRRALLLLLLAGSALAEEPVETLTPAQVRALLREGRSRFDSEDSQDLAEAARMFAAAADAADPGEVHVDAVRLAEAKAWLKADQPQRALEAFEKIQGFERAADRARHRMLRGNAQLLLGEQALAEEDFDAAKELMELAIESFVESLMENPVSEDAKRNLEIANRRLQYVIENEPPPPPPDEEPQEGEDPEQQPPEEEPEEQDPSEPESGEGEPEPQEQESEPQEGEDEGEPQPTDPREQEGDPSESQDPAPEWDEQVEQPSREMELEDDLSEEEVERALDALLEQERRLREQILQNRRLRRIPVEKDW